LKNPQSPPQLRRRHILLTGIVLAVAASFLLGPLACGPRTAKAPSGKQMTSPEKHWNYAEVKPTPSEKPGDFVLSINFAENSAALDREATGVLVEYAKVMVQKSGIRILILGLADGYGEKQDGEDLGTRRAQAARGFLNSQGVAKDRMETGTIGSAAAVAKPTEKLAQAQDRRVEVWLLEE
jgi:outer membrane protein OmpA-like peptidoglycan-associated protein